MTLGSGTARETNPPCSRHIGTPHQTSGTGVGRGGIDPVRSDNEGGRDGGFIEEGEERLVVVDGGYVDEAFTKVYDDAHGLAGVAQYLLILPSTDSDTDEIRLDTATIICGCIRGRGGGGIRRSRRGTRLSATEQSPQSSAARTQIGPFPRQ
eukprot:scaffold14569_cov49-Cyclotella_meneghiniana.AAC.1